MNTKTYVLTEEDIKLIADKVSDMLYERLRKEGRSMMTRDHSEAARQSISAAIKKQGTK
jgi:hypothetical protein